MRTDEEMMKLIMDVAINDERIRAVTMEGSRVSKNATHDQYCDFDICYVVNDIRQFTKDNKWIEVFGEILIVQYPDDWYSHPYDYAGHDNFAYLIQFKDGNRWSKLYVIYDFFAEIAKYVGEAFGYSFDAKETEEVRMFLSERQK